MDIPVTVLNIVLGVVYPIVVLVVSYFLISRFMLRMNRGGLFVGIGYMLLALVIQMSILGIAELVMIIAIVGFNITALIHATLIETTLTNFIKANLPWIALMQGLVAALCQETARYFAVKDRDAASSTSVGFGFSIIDVVFLIIDVLVLSLIPVSLQSQLSELSNAASLAVISVIGVLLNAPFSVLYHTGLSMYMKHSQLSKASLRGYFVAVVSHAYVDSMVAYLNSAAAFSILGINIMLNAGIAYWISVIIIGAFLFYIGYARIKNWVVSNAPIT